MEIIRRCIRCGKKFKAQSRHKRYCSDLCLNSTYRDSVYNLSAGTKGSIAELYVALDLFNKGYEVYRSLSPCCSGDLVVQKRQGFHIYKIEVKTGKNTDGITFDKSKIKSDVLAIYVNPLVPISYRSTDTWKTIKL